LAFALLAPGKVVDSRRGCAIIGGEAHAANSLVPMSCLLARALLAPTLIPKGRLLLVQRKGSDMPQDIRLWRVGNNDQLAECGHASLNLEGRLEEWLARDISILDADLLVIGRQVETAFGGIIDIFCINHSGDLVIVELKRDKTPREITAPGPAILAIRVCAPRSTMCWQRSDALSAARNMLFPCLASPSRERPMRSLITLPWS
jgi:hypothetical protein